MLKKKLYSHFVSGGLNKEQYESIREDIRACNTTSVSACSMCTLLVLIIAFLYDFLFNQSLAVKLLDSIMFIVNFSCLAFSRIKRKSFPDWGCYVIVSLAFIYGILLSVFKPTQPSVAYFVMLVLGPLLFYVRPFNVNIISMISVVIFDLVTIFFRDSSIARNDIPNALILFVMACGIDSYLNKIKLERVYLSYENSIMAKRDSLTGINNRMAFDDRVKELSASEERNVTCVYVDVNGLHELNDTQGHTAGDKMLIYVAKVFADIFGVENSYRIGGDEFVFFTAIRNSEMIEKIRRKAVEQIKKENYDIAFGYAPYKDFHKDIYECITEAEQMMYADKAVFYEATGKDRRRNRR